MTQRPVLDVIHSPVTAGVPSGACDCHVHVFGPTRRFPMWEGRSYTPPPAPVDALRAHQAALGLDRVIVVQPSIYGVDNRCTLDAIRTIGPSARGIAVVERDLSKGELDELAGNGIVGVRLNLAAGAVTDLDRIRRELDRAFALTAPLGWHVQIFAGLETLNALHAELGQAPVPLVIDHFGRADAGKGAGQPGFAALLDLAASGKAYVKLSAPYLISDAPDLGDVAGLAKALVQANPGRLLWGSNWPHPGAGTGEPQAAGLTPFRPVDDGQALDRLAGWVGDPAVLKRILVDNPARLFGFPDVDGSKT